MENKPLHENLDETLLKAAVLQEPATDKISEVHDAVGSVEDGGVVTSLLPLGQQSTIPPEPWSIVGHCSCGACTVTLRRPRGLMSFRCHCSTCREAYANDPVTKGSYSTPSLDWCCNVKYEGPITFTNTFAFSGVCLKRGACSRCKQPVVSLGRGLMTGFTFANVNVINSGLPAEHQIRPEFNMFYNSGNQAGEDDLNTYHSDIGSLVGFVGKLAARISMCRSCCCAWPR
mmetsp:Transcript_14228/g.35938  ORF Transcript_14228/g.35938 Transcript_14228/m.35938 type:complete len:230 (-) Transcript_14228:278-967(-)